MTLSTIHFVKRPLATHFLAKSPTNAKPQQERSRSCQILSDEISTYCITHVVTIPWAVVWGLHCAENWDSKYPHVGDQCHFPGYLMWHDCCVECSMMFNAIQSIPPGLKGCEIAGYDVLLKIRSNIVPKNDAKRTAFSGVNSIENGVWKLSKFRSTNSVAWSRRRSARCRSSSSAMESRWRCEFGCEELIYNFTNPMDRDLDSQNWAVMSLKSGNQHAIKEAMSGIYFLCIEHSAAIDRSMHKHHENS